MAIVGTLFGRTGNLPRTPLPYQLPLYRRLPISSTHGPILSADGTISEASPPACNFWVRANLREAASLADGLRQGCTMTITPAFEIIGAWRLSVRSKIKQHEAGRSPAPQETDQRSLICDPSSAPPGKAALSVIVSGMKRWIWPWIINLYGSQKYSNKSEIFA